MPNDGRGSPRTNFGFLEAHDEQLVRLGMLAERYFSDAPKTSLLKLRQLAELLAQLVASRVGKGLPRRARPAAKGSAARPRPRRSR